MAHKFAVVTHINRICVPVCMEADKLPFNWIEWAKTSTFVAHSIAAPRLQMIELTIERQHFLSCVCGNVHEFHGKQHFTPANPLDGYVATVSLLFSCNRFWNDVYIIFVWYSICSLFFTILGIRMGRSHELRNIFTFSTVFS